MTERLPTDIVEARLNHLIDRARRGALLPEEADRFTTELRDLVRRMEDTEDERDRAQRSATHRLAMLGKRREQIRELEAAVARLRASRNRWADHAGRLIGRAVTAEARVAEVQGRCPACGNERLFLGDGGHVTCPRIDCPNPTGADDLLHNRAPDWSTKPTTA